MRTHINQNGLTVNAISGTNVIFFGLDLAESQRTDFRGFGFKRVDHNEGDTIRLRGMKTFEKTEPHPAKGETFSTFKHPVQSFQWADYSAKPGHKYTYIIFALYGDPADLDPKIEVDIDISTEVESGPKHSVFFNRGSIATQEYARRFSNLPPNKVGPAAYEWLSRGLLEALIKFLERAQGGWEIYGAVYEFHWPEILKAIKQAHNRGAKVKILFDDIETYDSKGKVKGPWKKNREAIKSAKIVSLCKGRQNGKLMHNKFFILCENGNPKAVWTGSTNLTENGIFGHSNLGHIIEDDTVSKSFMDYWNRLAQDPEINSDYRDANTHAVPFPQVPVEDSTTAVFSPRGTNLDALEWYSQIAAESKDALFMTFAFGMHKYFKSVYKKNDSILRMALLEKDWSSPKTMKQDKKDIQTIRNLPNVVLAVGNRIVTNSFDRWLKELSKIIPSVHVYWIHTKYMLVDPLGDSPIIITGSANFSKASSDTNDENMIVIKGNKRAADIYFGEFLRLYNHYAFREAVKWYMEKNQSSADSWKPQYLVNDDTWLVSYFDKNDKSAKYKRREYFSGPMSI